MQSEVKTLRNNFCQKSLKCSMSKYLALDNHNLIPDFYTGFSHLVPANTITGVMSGYLLENIIAARNKFTTANNEVCYTYYT